MYAPDTVAAVTVQVYVAALAAFEAPVVPEIFAAVGQVTVLPPVPVNVQDPVPVGVGNGD